VVAVTNYINSLSDLATNLSKYVTSSDEVQVGHMMGYCIIGGLEQYIPNQKHSKSIPDIKNDEMKSIYDFSTTTIARLAAQEAFGAVSKDLEKRLNHVVDDVKKNPDTTYSVLLKNIAHNINSNKGSISGKFTWNGRMLLHLINSRNKTYRSQDIIIQDYNSIMEAFAKETPFRYGGRR
jgi:hypothetical protein